MISCEGKDIRCHKLVLAAGSPVFKAMIKSKMEESKNGEVELKDFSFEMIEKMIEFFYMAYLTEEYLDDFSEENIIPGSCSSKAFDVNLDSNIVRSKSEDPFQEDAGDVDLESADLLVSVGRGIEKEENIPMAFELAKVLGAEVSASRPVVDSGWIDSFRQVGSSGSNVAPKLYFSLGISGAIQHVVGMKGAKAILAINKDKDAPIFEIADYAVVGDVLEIVPKLTEVLKNQ